MSEFWLHAAGDKNYVASVQNANTRKKLLSETKSAIKQLLMVSFGDSDSSVQSEAVVGICKCLEDTLRFGLKPKIKSFFSFIQYIDHYPKGKEGIEVVKTLSEIHTDEGRGRAWLRRCLEQNEISDFFTILINNTDHVRVHYEDFALYSQHEEKNIFLNLLMGLSEIRLKIDYNERALDWSFDPTAKEPANLQTVTPPPNSKISHDSAVIVVNEDEGKEKSQGKKKKKIKKKVAVIESFENDNENDAPETSPPTKSRSDSFLEQKTTPITILETNASVTSTDPNNVSPTTPRHPSNTPSFETQTVPSIVNNVNHTQTSIPTLTFEENNNNNNNVTNINIPTINTDVTSLDNNNNSNTNTPRARPNKPLPSKPLPSTPPSQTKPADISTNNENSTNNTNTTPTNENNINVDNTKTTNSEIDSVENNSNSKNDIDSQISRTPDTLTTTNIDTNTNTKTNTNTREVKVESHDPHSELIIINSTYNPVKPISEVISVVASSDVSVIETKKEDTEKIESNFNLPQTTLTNENSSVYNSNNYSDKLNNSSDIGTRSVLVEDVSSEEVKKQSENLVTEYTTVSPQISPITVLIEASVTHTKEIETETHVNQNSVSIDDNIEVKVETQYTDSSSVFASLPSYCYIPGLSPVTEPETEEVVTINDNNSIASSSPKITSDPTILPQSSLSLPSIVVEDNVEKEITSDEITKSGNSVNKTDLQVPLNFSIGSSTSSFDLGVSFDSVQAPSSNVINIEDSMHNLEENIHNTTTVKGKNIILDGASVEYTDEIPDLDSELLSLSRSIEDLNINDELENENSSESSIDRVTSSKSIESSPVNLSRGIFFELHNTFTPPPREETTKTDTSFSPPNNKAISNEPSLQTQTQTTHYKTPTQNNATLSPLYRSPDNGNTVISNPPSPNTAPKIHDAILSPPQTASPVLQVSKPKEINTTPTDDGSIAASRKALWRSSSNPLASSNNIGKLPDKGTPTTEKSRQSTHIVISETRKLGEKDKTFSTKQTNGKESGNRLSFDAGKSPPVQRGSLPKIPTTSTSSPIVNTKQVDPSSSSKKFAVKENDSVKSLKTITSASQMWSPPRNRVYFNIHTPGKPQDQDYLCAGCGNEFSFGLFSTIRYCEYTGKLYCGKCHVGDSFFVPARVIHDWDHRAFPVSKHAKSFLEKSYREPLFDILAINPTLYKKSQSIASIRILRKQLFFLRDFIMTCTRSNLWKDIGLDTHSYLATEMHLYSLRDLINASDLLENMRSMVEKMFIHIKECELCKAKGSYCEFCSSKDIIYPFQLSLAIQCVGECKGVFHRKCYNKSKCPKCFRIAKRKMVGSIQEQKLMKE